MDKLKMHSMDGVAANIEKIGALFPNCVTETLKGGKVVRAIDFDMLRQELSDVVVEGPTERYQFTWPEKRKCVLAANAPISATLRPCREGSVDFDGTENLYIEGDNLDVLKLLQETYLGKIRVIYIDPPYNTGNDFVYDDDFVENAASYMNRSGEYDEQGNQLVRNVDSNGRFHTDWLNMIYPRLKLAKALLSEDGVIFISIDENEADKMKHICDEIFGKSNYRNQLLVRRRIKSLNVQFAENGLNSFNVGYEYVLVYSKSPLFLFNPLRMEKQNAPEKGSWNVFWSNADRPTMRYEILGFTPTTGQWRWQKDLADVAVQNYQTYVEKYSKDMTLEEYYKKTGEKLRFVRRIPDGTGKNGGVQYWVAPSNTSLRTSNWTDIEVSQIAKEFDLPFDNPKNINLLKTILASVPGKDFTVLDFFSGSATTADAVMRLNAEDSGTRKFIMVQIPEPLENGSEGYKQGFHTICDIGEERLRQAGTRIKQESPIFADTMDTGFRILKLDSSNMKDVYYNPDEYAMGSLFSMADNIKDDRTPEDLLFQVMLDLGILLSSKIEETMIAGKKVFSVADGYLYACFDSDVSEETVKAIAQKKPYYAVFRDSGFANDSVATNFEQIFETYSPSTTRKVL